MVSSRSVDTFKRVLLVFPPSTVYEGDPTKPAAVFPLGLAYLASYIRRHDYDVKILDCVSPYVEQTTERAGALTYGMTDEQFKEAITEWQPDVVGLTCMYTAYSGDIHRFAGIIKEWDKGCFVAVGGAHASIFPDLIMQDENIDATVIGEGEEPFLQLLQRLREGGAVDDIKGTWVRTANGLTKNSERTYIDDLDEIPWPAWDLLDMELYVDSGDDTAFAMRRRQMTMVTSRGCPGQCIYCTINSVWGRKWRGRSPEDVVGEIEHLHNTYGVEEFYFMDDSAGASKARLDRICESIIEKGLDIRWTTPNGIAHWTLDEQTLSKMKKAGCYRVTFGIESANPQTRAYIGKNHDLGQAKRMIDHANKIGMWTICTFIIGFPDETEEQIEDTIRFALESGTDFAVFYLLCPHPGTKVYKDFQLAGLLDFDDVLNPSETKDFAEYGTIGRALAGRGVATNVFTRDDLQNRIDQAFRRFMRSRIRQFSNPSRLMRKVHSYEDLTYTFKIGQKMTGTFINAVRGRRYFSQVFRRKELIE